MRDTNGEDTSANTAQFHGTSARGEDQLSGRERSPSGYSPEQHELLEHGLRILARLAVRAYFRKQAALVELQPGPRDEQCPQ